MRGLERSGAMDCGQEKEKPSSSVSFRVAENKSYSKTLLFSAFAMHFVISPTRLTLLITFILGNHSNPEPVETRDQMVRVLPPSLALGTGSRKRLAG